MPSKSKLVILTAIVLIVVISLSFVFVSLQSNVNSDNLSGETVLFQAGTYAPLAQGAFDGNITYAQIEKNGDFGLGTFNGLGEMVALNGVFYQINTDGALRQVDPSTKTPYALVTFFKADQSFNISQTMNYSQLTTYIDQNLPSLNSIYAVKIHVTCQYMEARSEPQLSPPFPSLSSALANETIFNLTNVTGTMVGFRFPDYMNGPSTAGYHFHFITDDKAAGGHVLNCTITSGIVEVDKIDKYVIMMP